MGDQRQLGPTPATVARKTGVIGLAADLTGAGEAPDGCFLATVDLADLHRIGSMKAEVCGVAWPWRAVDLCDRIESAPESIVVLAAAAASEVIFGRRLGGHQPRHRVRRAVG
ncbi:hypothetical protein [Micromonospora lupini]|uniref:Uncharacterized protein n=1 Tax=Micromonospora lupini str. Lupac 08 TaxID=1150864 RepID=I0KZH9_9ACTN|nr:hypothetical protein [Micromonospora lupini]CCH16976.1 hypothetical protein MILUP08_41894 [Micromonospora lupini str. Lupac 08]